MQPRTKRQKEVLDYITRFVDRNGYEPSYQQIARQLGVNSKGGVQRHIVALETQGLISRRRQNGSFGIEVHSRTADSGTVGNVELIDTDVEHRETARSMITIPKQILGTFSPSDLVAFRAVDDSLLELHICENDIVLLERRDYARRGQVTAICTADQIRLGQFRNLGKEVELSPSNAEFESVVFPADEITILGVMRGLVRPIPFQDN